MSTPVKARQPPSGHGAEPNPKHVNVATRVALKWPGEVADALGVSDEYLRKHALAAEIPMIRRGTLRLVRVSALDAWLAENERTVLGD
jgi:excisionase family DNA binding protein